MSKIKCLYTDRRENSSATGIVLGISLFLILVAFLLRYLSYRGFDLMTGWSDVYPNEYIIELLAVYLIAALIVAAVSWILPHVFSIETVIRLSVPIYLVVILFGIIKIVTSHSIFGYWIIIGPINLYLPAFFALGIFAVSYFVCKYKNYGIGYAAVITFIAVFIPCYIAGIGLKSFSISVELIVTFMLLFINLSKDGRLSQNGKPIMIIYIVALVVGVILLFYLRHDLFVERLLVGLTGGKADPTGTGLAYIRLREGLKEAKLVGMSTYRISDEGAVWQYFATEDTTYAPAVILFRYGWLALGVVLAAIILLIKKMYDMAFRAVNSYAKYVTYSVATFFLVRLILGLVFCFGIILSKVNLPFQGSTAYTLVDIILMNVAVVLSRKKDSSDLIDKDYSTNQMLIFLKDDLLPRLKEFLYSLPGFELDEDKLDENQFEEEEDIS